MSPVIRIDDEVLGELKKRAIDFGLVFEPVNATLRKLVGLASQTSIEPRASVSLTGNECMMLLNRIERTLSAVGFDMNRIARKPRPFCEDDICIFRGLSEAILSNRAVWSSVEPHLNTMAQALYGYDIDKVADLSDDALNELYMSRVKPLKIRSQRLRRGLREIRDNAKPFQHFRREHGSIRDFIFSYLNNGRIEQLRGRFIGMYPGFKLHGVGVAICSEFFKNIGIDEFKGDSNTARFFERIKIAEENASIDDIRAIGITIAYKSGRPRVFVDSLIWCFCAEGQAEVCTRRNPKCHLCKLNTEEPRLCTYSGIVSTPSIGDSGRENRSSAQLVWSDGDVRHGMPTQSDSDLLEKEAELNTRPPRPVIIRAGITYMNGECYRNQDGLTKNLIILDMDIRPAELRRLLLSYPNHYAGLSRYRQSPRRTSGRVSIDLVLNGQPYRAILNKGLNSGGAWISSGPVIDRNGRDIKLAGALRQAGFRVQYWTNLAIAHKLPPRWPPLQQVEFLVHGTTWTFPPHVG